MFSLVNLTCLQYSFCHKHILLTATLQCNSKLSRNIKFEKDIELFFNTAFQKINKKIKVKKAYFGKICRFHLTRSTSNSLMICKSIRWQLTGIIHQGGGEIHLVLLLQTQNFRGNKASEFPMAFHSVFNYFYIVQYPTIVFASMNI